MNNTDNREQWIREAATIGFVEGVLQGIQSQVLTEYPHLAEPISKALQQLAALTAPKETEQSSMEQWELTPDQKLQAVSLRYYQRLEWIPKKGDYYTSSRADLELYQIIDEDDENFYTVYCDPRRGNERSSWKKSEFLQGFGEHRVYVPDTLLLSQNQLNRLMHPEPPEYVHSMPLQQKRLRAALTAPKETEQGEGDEKAEAEKWLSSFADIQAIKDTLLYEPFVRTYVAGRTASQQQINSLKEQLKEKDLKAGADWAMLHDYSNSVKHLKEQLQVAESAEQILRILVELKDIHDNENATPADKVYYETMKPKTWLAARAYVAFPPAPEQQSLTDKKDV